MARKKKLNPLAITITGLIIGGVTFAAYKFILKPYIDRRKNLRNVNDIIDTVDIDYQNVT
jgi:hypothetical protein